VNEGIALGVVGRRIAVKHFNADGHLAQSAVIVNPVATAVIRNLILDTKNLSAF
jgi:hypothetical protein